MRLTFLKPALLFATVLFVAMIVPRPLYAERTINGTVEMVDPSILRITIKKTDSGELESFSVTNAIILKRLSKNDSVNVTIGNDGMINEIVKVTAPDQSPAKDSPPGR
jgi:hypothetical protein